jgi:L-amino acid N-acyltransferase YncA
VREVDVHGAKEYVMVTIKTIDFADGRPRATLVGEEAAMADGGPGLGARAVVVRPAGPADDAAIAAIWNAEVLGGTATTDTEPRDPAAQAAWLAAHGEAHPVVVAVDGGTVLGFGALSPYRPKPAFRFTLEDSVYVRAEARGRGVGAALLGRLLALARERGARAVMARITADNAASRRLHEALGFRLVGVEQATAFKHGRWLDIALFERLITPGPARRAAGSCAARSPGGGRATARGR